MPRYGRGIVAAVDAEGITVVFPEGSRRTFLPAFVQRVGSAPEAQRGLQKLPQALPESVAAALDCRADNATVPGDTRRGPIWHRCCSHGPFSVVPSGDKTDLSHLRLRCTER